MRINSGFNASSLKPFYLILMIGIGFFSKTNAQNIDWPGFVAGNNLVWDKGIDSNFYHGALIGDGIKGAMIMQDNKNKDGIRMLMGHYKAISHNSITAI